jgi:hypothetical protein
VINRHSIGDTTTAVVSDHSKLFVTERRHHLDQTLRHGAFAVWYVLLIRRRTAAATVARRVRANDRETGGQRRCDVTPHKVSFRKAMQQQDGRTRAAVRDKHRTARGFDVT